MAIYENATLGCYLGDVDNVIIPDEVVEKAIDSFTRKPIVKKDELVGMVIAVTNVDKENKMIYGTIILEDEKIGSADGLYTSLGIHINKYTINDETNIATIEDFEFLQLNIEGQ